MDVYDWIESLPRVVEHERKLCEEEVVLDFHQRRQGPVHGGVVRDYAFDRRVSGAEATEDVFRFIQSRVLAGRIRFLIDDVIH